MKQVLLITTILFLGFTRPSFAQNKIPISENIDVTKQIDELKDKVASKVASLKLVEKRGIIGTVTDVTDTQITINDLKDNIRFVDVDEFTKFSSPSAKASFGISDITKGEKLGVLGLYNKESRRTLARFVDVLEFPETFDGVIVSKNEKDFTIILTTKDEKQIKINVENITQTFSLTDGDLVKSGFTKIPTQVNATVIGFNDPKEKDTITASKLIYFSDLPADPTVKIVEDIVPAASAVPSTGSGVKLTPIK